MFSIFHHSRKAYILQHVWCENIFLTISGLSFWHQNSTGKACFSNTFLGPHISYFCSICLKTIDLGIPFKIQWPPKWDPKSTIVAKLSKSSMIVPPVKVCFRDLFFLKPWYLLCRLDLVVFLRSFVNVGWLIIILLYFSVCYLLSNICITFFFS